MRPVLAATLILIAAPAPVLAFADDARPSTPGAPVCEMPAVTLSKGDSAVRIQPLGQQPDARQIRAVVRTLDGCNKPIVVSDRVGFRGR